MHRNIADHALGGGVNFVVVELHLLLAHLSIERVELLLSGIQRRLRAIQLLLAHHPIGKQFTRALVLLPRVTQVRQLRRPRSLLAADRGLLLQRINLHQRSAGINAVTGLHKDLRDYAIYQRTDRRGISRLKSGDKF